MSVEEEGTLAEEFLTVEEASEILGRSVATVRRWCAAGTLPATRTGRQWLIRSADLPTRRRRSRIGPSAKVDVQAALTHVRSLDLAQLWVPDILRFEDRFANSGELTAAVRARLDGAEPVDPVTEVEIPKTPFFARAAALLTIEDRIAYQAAVGSIAPRIEASLEDFVFSARLNSPRSRFFLKNDRDQWLLWRNKITALAKTTHPWVIETDISAYFDSIQHSLLYSELDVIAPPDISNRLKTMLSTWSTVSGLGIPQGPNASRVLGNYYLVPVDQAMASAPCIYLRFQDDIRLLGTTRASVLAAQRLLDRECRRRGLALSAHKTRLVHGDELSDASDDDFDAAQYAMDAGDDDEARTQLRKILKTALKSDGATPGRAAKFSLYRLTQLRDDNQLRRVLRRLEDLAPLAPIVARYLRPWLARSYVQRDLEEFFFDNERNASPYLTTWLFAVLLDYQGKSFRPGIFRYAEAVGFDRNQPTWLRAVALNLAARDGNPRTVVRIRQIATAEYDPILVRAALTALARARRLDRSTARAVMRVDPKLAQTAHFLQGRTNLPSLVYAGQWVDI